MALLKRMIGADFDSRTPSGQPAENPAVQDRHVTGVIPRIDGPPELVAFAAVRYAVTAARVPHAAQVQQVLEAV
jgi:hypothetical protein